MGVTNLALFATEEILAEQGTYTQRLTDEQAEGNDDKCHGERDDHFEYEVGAVGIEPNAYLWQLWQQNVVEQVYVERPHSDILKTAPDDAVLCEPCLIMAEEDHNERKQGVHGQRAWQIGPRHSTGVPSEEVGARHECHDHQQR